MRCEASCVKNKSTEKAARCTSMSLLLKVSRSQAGRKGRNLKDGSQLKRSLAVSAERGVNISPGRSEYKVGSFVVP